MQTLVEPPELGLPDELWLQVLLILGVEDVIRMRGVSKYDIPSLHLRTQPPYSLRRPNVFSC